MSKTFLAIDLKSISGNGYGKCNLFGKEVALEGDGAMVHGHHCYHSTSPALTISDDRKRIIIELSSYDYDGEQSDGSVEIRLSDGLLSRAEEALATFFRKEGGVSLKDLERGREIFWQVIGDGLPWLGEEEVEYVSEEEYAPPSRSY